ncbi:MAG TPA: tryptophan synthase subunit alpha [Gemmatimonadaceae bacterium]|nr:tryptophan synthase subunit alpha [Gemmatimonadaceae bacterium]
MASASAIISSESIARKFAALRADSRRALVCYVTAGHPSRSATVELLEGLDAAGADVIELGVPFSDPVADGPVIQESSAAALANGMTLDGALDVLRDARVSAPVVLFTYLNPLLAAGPGVLDRAAAAGVAGMLVTDLPLGADPEREAWLSASGLDFIRLVAPTTPESRLAGICEHGSGFVYLISRMGVTGTREEAPADVAPMVRRLRTVTDLPVCVGFGISTPAQARAVAQVADGVVVGSAIVKAAGRSVDAAVNLVRSMREAMDG